MRLITRRIWRAFPELDGYSDEEAKRLVRVARRQPGWFVEVLSCWTLGWLISGLPAALIVATPLGALFFGPALGGHGFGAPDPLFGQPLTASLTFSTLTLTAIFIGLGHRDRLLRRAIVELRRPRLACADCGYSLVGLRECDQEWQPCPECGFENRLDPSLRRLAAAASGRAAGEPAVASGLSSKDIMNPL